MRYKLLEMVLDEVSDLALTQVSRYYMAHRKVCQENFA